MDASQVTGLLASTVVVAVPLIFSGVGELITERSGVLNLGVEGMMLVGAASGYAATALSGSPYFGLFAGLMAGVVLAGIFGFLTLTLMSNQVATGLAITIFGIGFSAYLGKPFTTMTIPSTIGPWHVPVLSDIPLIGPAFFQLPPVAYLAFVLVPAASWFLSRSRGGLILRSVGEAPEVAHQVGFQVVAVRYYATLFGGAMSGLAGAYYSVVYLHLWQEQLTAGRGWIALALVVFATWRPWRLLAGAVLFGFVMALQFYAQAIGVGVPTQFLAMLPYCATVAVLVVISRNPATIKLNAPASLGRAFFAAK